MSCLENISKIVYGILSSDPQYWKLQYQAQYQIELSPNQKVGIYFHKTYLTQTISYYFDCFFF